MNINNDPENSSSTTVAEHIPSGFSMSKMLSFKSIENRHDVYRGKKFLIKFCKFLREHAKKIISKRKKVKLLTNEQQKLYQNSKICYICRKKFEGKHTTDEKYSNVRDHCHYKGEYTGALHSICNLRYSIPREIRVAFHNGSNNDYHFIIKELAEEFVKQFNC